MNLKYLKSTGCALFCLYPLLSWGVEGNLQEKQFPDIKPASECTESDCPSGAYLVNNAEEFEKISDILEFHVKQVKQKDAHWTNNRYAILVASGDYKTSKPFHLGYYTQILGVGELPTDVNLNPGIMVLNQCDNPGVDSACQFIGGLNNFWRGIENVQMTINQADGNPYSPLRLAISQATALRRLNVTGPEGSQLLLCDWNTGEHAGWACGYTSGGFLANSNVHSLIPGSQQQWLTRNSKLIKTEKAVWNSIYVGSEIPEIDTSNPAKHYAPQENDWEKFPVTKIDTTPVVREKPYLVKHDSGWKVRVPNLKSNTIGVDWTSENTTELDISQFYVMPSNPNGGVTHISSDQIKEINTQLAEVDRHLLIMPGVYDLEGTLNVVQDDTVILGLGIPALVCSAGPCMDIHVEKGVKLAGVTFDAGYTNTEYLLKVGNGGGDNSANPHSLSDVYIRIAETQDSVRNKIRQTKTAVIINSNHVIGDNLWIWRGDHDKASGQDADPSKNLVKWNENTGRYGIIINGDDVTMYGLAVEHFQDYQTVWYGERGRVYFYQSEAPYDFDSEIAPTWECTDPRTGGDPISQGGCQAYVIGKDVEQHTAYGVGIYSYFAFEKVKLPSAILAPTKDGIAINHIIGHWLNGVTDSSILNLVRDYPNEAGEVNCWGYQATCSNIDENDICLDGGSEEGESFRQTSILGNFDIGNFDKTQACTDVLLD